MARAREAMSAAGVDGLLVWKNPDVHYLTGLRAQIIARKSALMNGCLLDHAPILLASGDEVQRAKVVMPWIEEINAVPIMEAAGPVCVEGSRSLQQYTRAQLFHQIHFELENAILSRDVFARTLRSHQIVHRMNGACPAGFWGCSCE